MGINTSGWPLNLLCAKELVILTALHHYFSWEVNGLTFNWVPEKWIGSIYILYVVYVSSASGFLWGIMGLLRTNPEYRFFCYRIQWEGAKCLLTIYFSIFFDIFPFNILERKPDFYAVVQNDTDVSCLANFWLLYLDLRGLVYRPFLLSQLTKPNYI